MYSNERSNSRQCDAKHNCIPRQDFDDDDNDDDDDVDDDDDDNDDEDEDEDDDEDEDEHLTQVRPPTIKIFLIHLYCRWLL